MRGGEGRFLVEQVVLLDELVEHARRQDDRARHADVDIGEVLADRVRVEERVQESVPAPLAAERALACGNRESYIVRHSITAG